MSELKPCPFCGGEAELCYSEVDTFCRKCNVMQETELWNTRPIEDALRLRIAELEEAQRWIPVGERLPENGGEYWVWFDDDFTGIKTSGYCDYSKQNGWDNTERVTHWMPLPARPEVQE